MTEILHVRGMTCGHCEKAVAKAIQNIDPQARVQVSREAQRVEVDGGTAPREALAAAIRAEGYEVQP